MSPTRATTIHLRDEEKRVRKWRRDVLLEVGVPFLDACRLADSDADLHKAVDLVKRGCAPELVRAVVL
jgi:hypothetical protein